MSRLCQYSFPGNIRELKSIVEQSALLANEDVIEASDLPEQVLNEKTTPHSQPKALVSLDEAEKAYLQNVCETQSLNIDELAETLGVSTRTLYRKLQKYDLKYE
jgi:transcriptional regulator of acetoin/glycerol metabolism